ncbi:MAG: hypothetical protein WBA93_06120 [Microcoleaceae cyanobacterium]
MGIYLFTNEDFCLFWAADPRSRAELESQSGSEYGGVLTSDDLSVYNGYRVKAKHFCRSH